VPIHANAGGIDHRRTHAGITSQYLVKNKANISRAVYSELGKAAKARAEIAEVLRLNPPFSLEVHKQRMPIKDPAVLERHIAALRKAGLK
jgi:hypothetical protein